jgi:hypothetical protein
MPLALLLLLTAAAALAAPQPWDRPPVAPPTRDARDPFLSRWHRATADVVDENVWFRALSADLDVRWRVDQLGLARPADAALRDRTLEQAIAGTYLGWDRAVRQWMQTTDALSALYGVGSALSRPALRVEAGPEGRRLRPPDEAAARNADAARAAIDQGPAPGARPRPALQLGSAVTFVELPRGAEALSAAQGPQLRASAQTYLQAWALGVDAARLEAAVRAAERPLARPPSLAVRAIAREGLGARAALVGEASVEPARPRRSAAVRAAAEVRLQPQGSWWLRATAGQAPGGPVTGPIQFAELGLRANLGWRAPQHVDRWTLGQQPMSAPHAGLALHPGTGQRPAPPPAVPALRHADPPAPGGEGRPSLTKGRR